MKADIEDGYTKVANTLLEAVYRCDLTARQFRVFLALIRKTYGFNRKIDNITASQISDEIGYSSCDSNIRADLKVLKNRRLVLVDGRRIGPNPHVSEWVKSVENNTIKRKQKKGKSVENNTQECRKQHSPNSVENNTPRVSKSTLKSVENNTKRVLKTTHTKENINKNKKDTSKKRDDSPPVDQKFTAPDWLNKSLFADFVDMRKKIKKPMTEKAKELAVKKLSDLVGQGYDQDEVIELAIMNSWQGFYPPKNQNRQPRHPNNNAAEIQAWLDEENGGAL